jgi:hypothetical protein
MITEFRVGKVTLVTNLKKIVQYNKLPNKIFRFAKNLKMFTGPVETFKEVNLIR